MKTLRNQIIERLAAIPERQVSPGVYVKSIGYKYVHVINTWEKTRVEKMTLQEFAEYYMPSLLKK